MRGCPGRGFPLKEVPHAHADLGELFFDAAVVPFFFRLFRFFLVQREGVVVPSVFPVGFRPDLLDVIAVKVVFFFKFCDAVFNDLFDFGKILLHGGSLRVVCVFFCCVYIRSKTGIYQVNPGP